MSGWIKLHRQLLEWEWYSDKNCRILFLHCLLLANFEDTKWRGVEIKKGSFISSLGNLSQSSGLTIRELRTALTKIKTTGEMTSKGHAEYTVFTIVKYDEYQSSDTPKGKPKTSKRQASDKQATTVKEEEELKEEKELKNIYRSFAHLEILESEFLKLQSEGFSKSEIDDVLNRIENYKKNTNYKSLYLTALTWLKSDRKKSNQNGTGKKSVDEAVRDLLNH